MAHIWLAHVRLVVHVRVIHRHSLLSLHLALSHLALHDRGLRLLLLVHLVLDCLLPSGHELRIVGY